MFNIFTGEKLASRYLSWRVSVSLHQKGWQLSCPPPFPVLTSYFTVFELILQKKPELYDCPENIGVNFRDWQRYEA